MHAHWLGRHLRIAPLLAAAVVVTQTAEASETVAKQGTMVQTTGTATVRVDRGQEAESFGVVDADGKPNAGRLQIASVDVSSLRTPAAPITFRSATVEVPASVQLQAAPLALERAASSRSAEASNGSEPGFWAPVLSTLALAVFFFLRRRS
jgi:hypothetical protein